MKFLKIWRDNTGVFLEKFRHIVIISVEETEKCRIKKDTAFSLLITNTTIIALIQAWLSVYYFWFAYE